MVDSGSSDGSPVRIRRAFPTVHLIELGSAWDRRRRAIAGYGRRRPGGSCWSTMTCMHLVASPLMTELGYSSKPSAEWDFLCMLRDEGRRVADASLRAYGDDLGRRSSVDLDRLLEGV